MIEDLVVGTSLPEVYHKSLVSLKEKGEIVDCPDYNTTQREISMTMVVNDPLMEPRISALFMGDAEALEQYIEEIVDGILDFEVDKGNWKYTYHQRMTAFPVINKNGIITIADQIQFIIDDLKRNPDSRRAVISIRDNGQDMNSIDPACLQHMQFFIRNGKLHLKVLFRSNDACKAAFMNAYALIEIQKKVADILKIPIGVYVHRANSYHCYERDFGMLDGYINRIKNNMNNTFFYNGDWDDMMNEAKEIIKKKVEDLKNK